MIVSNFIFMIYFGYKTYEGVLWHHWNLDNCQHIGISTEFS